MANGVFNIAKGRVNELVTRVAGNDPTNSALVGILLKVAEADATLEDYDTISALLAGANTECDFTNYARVVWTDAVITAPTPDDTNNWQQADVPDWVIANAGGATNNTLVKIIIAYDNDSTAGDDTNLVPLIHADLSATTNGDQLTVQPSTGQVFFRAT